MNVCGRWLLLCALVLGVILMHHTGTGSPGHDGSTGHAVSAVSAAVSTAQAEPPADGHPAPGHAGDLLHLCLAVLFAAAGLVLTWWLLARAEGPAPVARGRTVKAPARAPPPRSGRAILHLACVLRV